MNLPEDININQEIKELEEQIDELRKLIQEKYWDYSKQYSGHSFMLEAAIKNIDEMNNNLLFIKEIVHLFDDVINNSFLDTLHDIYEGIMSRDKENETPRDL